MRALLLVAFYALLFLLSAWASYSIVMTLARLFQEMP